VRDGRQVIAILCGGGLSHAAGGIGQLTSYLLEAWAEAENATVVRQVIDTRGRGGRLAGIGAFARAAGRLAAVLGGGRLGLVHANMSTRGSAWRKCALCGMARSAGVPTVVHLHGADFREYRAALPRWRRALLDATLRRAARVIVLGRCWQALLVDEAGLSPERVVVVPNGVPAPRPSCPGPAGGAAEIVLLGRLGARKGVPELLAALASPELRGRDWRATLAGDGAVEAFGRQVEQLGLGERVRLPGWVDRETASALLARADIFVLPSHHEGMPLAVIEALAHGVAVVATPVGANPEFLAHEHNALLVPPGDARALATAIGRLLDDAELRQRLGRAGRETFEARLAIGVVAARIAGIHREAMAGVKKGWGSAPNPAKGRALGSH
jgi:glycosyltransferase involved in cell wall biosynthesis